MSYVSRSSQLAPRQTRDHAVDPGVVLGHARLDAQAVIRA